MQHLFEITLTRAGSFTLTRVLSQRKRRRANRMKVCAVSVWAVILVSFVSGNGIAQSQIERVSTADDFLPDAPVPPQIDPSLGNRTATHATGAASVSGKITDSTGAAIPNAQVTLMLTGGRHIQTLQSSTDGGFTFSKLSAGSYLMTVDAAGFASFKTDEFSITDQQAFWVSDILLAVAGETTDVVVRPTEVIAAEQIKAEEKQRLLGVFPNFYVSYVPDAAPLTSRQKLSLATHDTLDWTSLVGVSAGAGIEQATNSFKGYGQGAEGYGKRWGALFADGRISDFLSHYVFASAFHQDPRYFYQGTGTNKSRLYHALSSGFVARSDSGKTMPNYSYLLGNICAGALSNAYYPSSDRGVNLVFTNAAIGIAGRSFQGVIQEFVAKRLTKHAPESSAPTSSNGSTTRP